MSPHSDEPTRTALCAALTAALLAAYAPLLVFGRQDTLGAFKFFAADTFYYLAIAAHSGAVPGFSFDGVHPTNGFHPLWGWLWTALFEAFEPSRATQVRAVFGVSVALTAASAALVAHCVARATGRFGLAVLTAVPGLYFIALPRFNANYGASWSFANGMESPLSLLFFGLLLRALLRPGTELRTLHRRLDVAVLAAALVLSRLDDAMLVAAFGIALLVAAPNLRSGTLRAARFATVPAIAIAITLAINLGYAGVALPVSGTAKAQGLFGLLRNGYGAMTTLLPFVDPLGRGALFWGDQAYRIAQMVVPALVAAAWLLRERQGVQQKVASDSAREVTSVLALYVLLKAGYNFAFVGLWHQGHWYYPLSIAIAGWIAALWLDAWLVRTPGRATALELGRLRISAGALGSALCIVLGLTLGSSYAQRKIESPLHELYHSFWERREVVERDLESICPDCGVLEFDDGIVAYSLERRVMSGSGLALDREADAARRRGDLLGLAWERGFRLIGSLYYALDDEAYESEASLRSALAATSFLEGQDIDDWHFAVAHTDEPTGVVFIGFEPR